MRDAILTSLLLASATLTSASRLECLSTRSRQLAAAASCGDEGYLNYCFSNLPADTEAAALTPLLERCFVKAGCTPAESQIEAVWLLRRCDAPAPDLRRAARHPQPNDANDANPLAAAAAIAARDPLPAITAMNNPVLPRQTAGSGATAAASTSAASPSPCFTDTTSSTTSCPIQTTGSNSGKKLDCFPTVVTSAVCREGLICQSDGQGNPSCMYKQSGLGLDGAIIAAVFATAIAVSIVSICVLCCRERRAHKRVERAAEAARIAKEAKTQATVAAKRPGVGVTGNRPSSPVVEGQPLMYQTGGGGASSPGPHQTTFGGALGGAQGQGYGAANPFADGEHDAHPLR